MKNNKGEKMFMVHSASGQISLEMVLFVGAFFLLIIAMVVYIMRDQTNAGAAIQESSAVKIELTKLSTQISEWEKDLKMTGDNIQQALENQGAVKTYFENAQADLREQNAKIRALEHKVKSQDEKIAFYLSNPKPIKIEPVELIIKKKILVMNKSRYPNSLLEKAGIIPKKKGTASEKENPKKAPSAN